MRMDGIACFEFVNSNHQYLLKMKSSFIPRMLFALLFSLALNGFGQEQDPDSLYIRYNHAYKTLDADLLADCYVEGAVLLSLYDGSDPISIKGSEKIKAYFDSFFQQFRDNGQQLELTFKITDRQKIGETVYDNGYYKLSILSEGNPVHVGHGKLSALITIDDGHWKFSIDANTNTDEAEFAKVGAVSIPRSNR